MMFRSIINTLTQGRYPVPPLPDPANPMTAVVMDKHGSADELHLVESFPSPRPAPAPAYVPAPRQVLVQVCAAGLNPLDCKMRKGPIADLLYPKPKILGSDVSGKVLAAPAGSAYKPGDRVFAMLPLLGTQYGAYASLCCVDEEHLAKAPAGVSLVDLATIPLVACTVVQAFRPVEQAYHNDTAGKRCFITAGSGGLGSFAIQYCAKVLGMHVIASGSARNSDFMKELGANEVVDYHTGSIEEHARNVDVFFDSLSYLHEEQVLNPESGILKLNGHYIHIASSPFQSTDRDIFGLAIPEARLSNLLIGYFRQLYHNTLAPLFRPQELHYHFILVHPDRTALERIAPYLEAGSIVPVVQQRFGLGQAAHAHQLLQTGHVRGKVLLEVDTSLNAD